MSSAWSIIGKFAIGLGVIVLLSLGLCGVAMQFGGNGSSGTAADIGFFGFMLGCGGLVLTGFAAIVVAVMTAFRGRTPPPPAP